MTEKKLDFIRTIEAAQRKINLEAALAARAAGPYDQSGWALLYGAMVNGFGLDPGNFQMVYPFIVWDWPSQSLGHIGADQYDTLSTIPAWSAIGKYVSTASRFNDMYQSFLNVIDPDTSDPDLRGRIDDAWSELVEKTNEYDRVVRQAMEVYDEDPDPEKPSFTKWLGTLAGKGWQTKIVSAEKGMTSAEAVYSSLVGQTRTPNLTEALEAFSNADYWSKLNDPNLKNMPPVPAWSTPVTAAQWKDRAQRGEVPGAAIGFSNADRAYDYSKTWAKGSAKITFPFWGVKVKGEWQRIDTFSSDASLSASLNFGGVETVGISPGSWYRGVLPLQNGPYKRGYSKYGEDDTTAVFGEKGFLTMLKTGMIVAYKPTFTITVSQSTYKEFKETFKACAGIRIGPFELNAEGGIEKAGWHYSDSGLSFTGTSTSKVPAIVGFTVQVLP